MTRGRHGIPWWCYALTATTVVAEVVALVVVLTR